MQNLKVMSRTDINMMMGKIMMYMMETYGCDAGAREFSPLMWYVETGRASLEFLNRLWEAKQFMVARRLHKGGTDEEAIRRVKKLLNVL